MPLNTEVDYNNVIIKGTVELGVKGERGLQGFKGDQGIQGPPVPVAHELGDDPDLAVSQKLLTDSIAESTAATQEIIDYANEVYGKERLFYIADDLQSVKVAVGKNTLITETGNSIIVSLATV